RMIVRIASRAATRRYAKRPPRDPPGRPTTRLDAGPKTPSGPRPRHGADALIARARSLLANIASISRPLAGNGRQHDLSDMLARFDAGMCGGALVQRERAVDDRLHASLCDERQHVGFDRTRNRALVLDRAGAQRRAGVGQALEHDAAEIDRGLRASLK